MACARGLVEKNGAWFSLNGERIAQGRERACEWLREHAAAMDELTQKLAVAAEVPRAEPEPAPELAPVEAMASA